MASEASVMSTPHILVLVTWENFKKLNLFQCINAQ